MVEWLGSVIVRFIVCVYEVVGKYVKFFFFERCFGICIIIDVSVYLKGRNKFW